MAVRVQLTVAPAAGGHTGSAAAAEEPALTLRGEKVTILLAGLCDEVASALEKCDEQAPTPEFVKPVVLTVPQLAAAGVTSCEELGRMAFSKAFGVSAGPFKLYDKLRVSVASEQHLARWLATRDSVALEPNAPPTAEKVASEELEVVYYCAAREMVAAWRFAVGVAWDSGLIAGQAADSRFSLKVFAKLVEGSVTHGMILAAVGRGSRDANVIASREPPPPGVDVCFQTGLIRRVEDKLAQLRANKFGTLGAEIDAVSGSKKRAAPDTEVEENGEPNAATAAASAGTAAKPAKKAKRTNFNAAAKTFTASVLAERGASWKAAKPAEKREIEEQVWAEARGDAALEADSWEELAVKNLFHNYRPKAAA